MRYERRFCAECKMYSVHYEDRNESPVCVHHASPFQRALVRHDHFRDMHGGTIDLLNEALRMTEDGLAKGITTPLPRIMETERKEA